MVEPDVDVGNYNPGGAKPTGPNRETTRLETKQANERELADMRTASKILVAAIAAIVALPFLFLAPASADDGARIHLIHGIPDVDVDVEAGGDNVFEDFSFGDTQDLSALAGATLEGLKVKAAGTDTVAIDAGDAADSMWRSPSPEHIDVQPYSGWADTDASIGYRIALPLGDFTIHLVPLVGVTMGASGAESRIAFEDSVRANSPFGLGLGPRAAAPHVGLAIDLGFVRVGYKVVFDLNKPSAPMHMLYLSFPL